MAISNKERVDKALELLRQGLAPYVEREVQASVKAGSVRMDAIRRYAEDPILSAKPILEWDVAGLLRLMSDTWNDVFRKTLGFALYLYLPRLVGPAVLLQAIQDGLALLTWQSDTFAYAESYDEAASRYRGLRAGQLVGVSADSIGVLVKPDVARRQSDEETPTATPASGPVTNPPIPGTIADPCPVATPQPPSPPALRRFHGTWRSTRHESVETPAVSRTK
jgi:hypothetical protein